MRKFLVPLLFLLLLSACGQSSTTDTTVSQLPPINYKEIHNEIILEYRASYEEIQKKYYGLQSEAYKSFYKKYCNEEYEEYLEYQDDYKEITEEYLADTEIARLNELIKECDRLLHSNITKEERDELMEQKANYWKEKEKIICEYNDELRSIEMKMMKLNKVIGDIYNIHREELDTIIFDLEKKMSDELTALVNQVMEELSRLEQAEANNIPFERG